MKIKDLEREGILAPFLSSPLSYISGQDPLGLLIISERTFRALLPGLNNVTSRIRYYSFYCWFFNFYAEHIGINDKRTQFDHLRRGEYILALLSVMNDWQGIPGVNKAKELLDVDLSEQSLTQGTYEGLDSFEGSYWKNSRGVFGQNYVSSMIQIGLLREKDEQSGTVIRTAFEKEDRISGKQLAEAFSASIGQEAEQILIKAVSAGVIRTDALHHISEALNMKKVPHPCREHELLWKLFTGPDEPKNGESDSLRKHTIGYLLSIASAPESKLDRTQMVDLAYAQQGRWNGEEDEAFRLWYYFQLDQYWHMACTGSLCAFLHYLEDTTAGTWVIEREAVREMALDTEKRITDILDKNSSETFTELNVNDISEADLVSDMSSKDPSGLLARAIILIKKLSVFNETEFVSLSELARKHQLSAEGNFMNGSADLQNHRDKPLMDFIIHFLNKHVIMRHQWVAYKKMTISQSTEKFIREDGRIRFVENIDFDFSDARLGTLTDFISDLQLVNHERTDLSQIGHNALAELNR